MNPHPSKRKAAATYFGDSPTGGAIAQRPERFRHGRCPRRRFRRGTFAASPDDSSPRRDQPFTRSQNSTCKSMTYLCISVSRDVAKSESDFGKRSGNVSRRRSLFHSGPAQLSRPKKTAGPPLRQRTSRPPYNQEIAFTRFTYQARSAAINRGSTSVTSPTMP